jgi:hypothetical protein
LSVRRAQTCGVRHNHDVQIRKQLGRKRAGGAACARHYDVPNAQLLDALPGQLQRTRGILRAWLIEIDARDGLFRHRQLP